VKRDHIVVKGLSVSYGSFRALAEIGFECRAGEFVAIVGKSGGGKTSFLNALAGFIPYEGEVQAPERVGYVFQNYSLFPWMTVAQNIEFGLGPLPRSERKKRVTEILARIEMAEFRKRYPSQLSGGQIQRVALARALAPDPDLLLMDEPYAALDHHTRERMQDWLLAVLQETPKIVIFVTHFIEEAIYLADRIIVLKEKKFVSDLKTPFQRPRTREMRFSEQFLDMKQRVLSYMEGEV